MSTDFFYLFPELRAEIPATSLSICRPLGKDVGFGVEGEEGGDMEVRDECGLSYLDFDLEETQSTISVS